ncbi:MULTISPECIES: hypothetical protein [unclassified Microbacterium]|uniref:hypothetical protein n=1 Tax=unclassified Microbacterium TaxID=2609290 RepID=UPI00288315CF|nr:MULTISPECIES: hypothetical protein [unclassified Microbacterium]
MNNTKPTRRQLTFLSLTLGLILLGYVIAFVLTLNRIDGAGVIVATLPSVALTVFTPALGEATRTFRSWTLALLLLVVILGQIVIGIQIAGASENPWPSIIVAIVALIITATVSFFDWTPAAPTRFSPADTVDDQDEPSPAAVPADDEIHEAAGER